LLRCGRIQRTDEKWGNIYDHFNTTFEWEDGVRAFSSCRQISGAASDVSDWVWGTKGKANIQAHRIWADENWRHKGDGPDDMYQNEHDRMFEAIQRAYYTEARNPSLVETLIELAGEIGLDGQAFASDLQAAETESRLQADFDLRRRLQATAFPSLILEHGSTCSWVAVVTTLKPSRMMLIAWSPSPLSTSKVQATSWGPDSITAGGSAKAAVASERPALPEARRTSWFGAS